MGRDKKFKMIKVVHVLVRAKKNPAFGQNNAIKKKSIILTTRPISFITHIQVQLFIRSKV